MSGKLLSLFTHPEFVRRSQARAERELAERVRATPGAPMPCPPCDSAPDFDTIEAFLDELLRER